jgi:hypothetical protein
VRIVFWPHTPSADVASTRIRCLQVVDALRLQGLLAEVGDGSGEAPDVLVLAKRYDAATLTVATGLSQRGTRVVLDLCDNHFYYRDPAPQWIERAQQLRTAVASVDHVVAASGPLADVVRDECGGAAAVSVIPDGLDAGPPQRRATLKQRWQLLGLRRFLARHPVAAGRRLLWFGNHGAQYADGGLQDLSRIVDSLRRHHAREPLTLTIVSNSREAYERWRPNCPVPSLYLPWSTPAFAAAMRDHAVALIPAQSNPFTRCKTNNRLATAFMNGLGVVADSLPPYEEFADLAVLDDWDAGLAALMTDAVDRARRVQAARERLRQRYSVELIAQQWMALVRRLCAAPATHSRVHGKEPV